MLSLRSQYRSTGRNVLRRAYPTGQELATKLGLATDSRLVLPGGIFNGALVQEPRVSHTKIDCPHGHALQILRCVCDVLATFRRKMPPFYQLRNDIEGSKHIQAGLLIV